MRAPGELRRASILIERWIDRPKIESARFWSVPFLFAGSNKELLPLTGRLHCVRSRKTEPVWNVTDVWIERPGAAAPAGANDAGWLPSKWFAKAWLALREHENAPSRSWSRECRHSSTGSHYCLPTLGENASRTACWSTIQPSRQERFPPPPQSRRRTWRRARCLRLPTPRSTRSVVRGRGSTTGK